MFTYSRHQALRRSAPPLVLQDVRGNPPDSATFVGSLGSEHGTHDITVLGDAPNTAARLSTNAQQGEILISEASFTASGLDLSNLDTRELQLKGKSEPVLVWVMRV